jgi:hypothetical protein
MKVKSIHEHPRLKIQVGLLFLALGLNLACSNSHETAKLAGNWHGHHSYTYEEKVVSETAQTLEDAIGRIISSTEIQDSVVFNFVKDSVWFTTSKSKTGLRLLPDEQNRNNFLLIGDPTLALVIVKHTMDSLILEEQTPPVTFMFGGGQIRGSTKVIIKSSYVLTKL